MSKIVFHSTPASQLGRNAERDGLRAWEDAPR